MNKTGNGKRTAAIIGGSISGVFAALILRHHGWQVDVFERSYEPLIGRGAGIVIQPQATSAFAAAGLHDMADLGTVGITVDRRLVLDGAGAPVLTAHCPQYAVSWERIYGLLCARLGSAGYHRGKELAALDTTGDRPTAQFTDGSRITADLIIGADGVRSTVRAQLFADARLEYSGYVAWRGMIDEPALPPDVHRDIFWSMTFALPPGEQFIGYPVTGPNDSMRPGSLRYNVVWYRPALEHTELQRLLTDDHGHVHALSIPPPLIRAAVRDELHAAAGDLLPPQFQSVLSLLAEPFLQPIYDLQSRHMAARAVAIIGDAAFVARPHVAAGVFKAVDDAKTLALALEAEPSIADALKRFEAERLAVGHRIIERARALGANYSAADPHTPAKKLSVSDAHYARRVIEDTALITFLEEG